MSCRMVTIILTLALGMLVVPFRAAAQQPRKVYRIGYLTAGSGVEEVFRQALRQLGYVEGQNIVIEGRFAERKLERLPDLAAELVRLKVDVIVTITTPGAQAAKNATATIPVVMAGSADPVELGLVASLARPGENISGITDQAIELIPKRLELLKESVPKASRVAVVWNSADRAMTLRYRQVEAAAQALGVRVQPFGVRDPSDFDGAFSAMNRERPDAIFIISDALTNIHRKRVLDFAATNRLPAMYEDNRYVNDGGLMSYGPSFSDMWPRAAYYVDKILKGARPGDLPVEQPTRYYLIINLKTAKALGLRIPQSVLIRADQVIQ
ncbi:MAG TPA: ABC transporter substrate-binding protein [Candidatus Methylomirabilis sp.]|nr:ABC transporter substrate-binding protein [Candidatus Methylomirabilis sp.]